jgi:hypothetical protein
MAHCLIIIFCFFPVAWASGLYSMEDLRALEREESYQEFFDHALDIRPSERLEAWSSMVTKMADIYSRKISEKSDLQRTDFLKIEELYQWQGIKTDDIFKVRRQNIGIRYIKKCLNTSTPCWSDLKLFWENDKSDPDTAFKLAEITSTLKNSPLSSWSFLEVALKGPLSEFFCKKEFVLKALWKKVELESLKMGLQGDLMKKIDLTIHPDCLPSLISEARKRLFSPLELTDRELAFQILKSQMKDGQEISDFFYTVYLLDNPAQGELLNYSWNRVKELGGKAQRREAVLSKLKNLDPLPDSLFSSFDQVKKRVVMKHFKSYFPEYIDYYLSQCFKFYAGQGVFPKGNPTIHCQDFMNSEFAPLIIGEDKMKRYQEIRKI